MPFSLATNPLAPLMGVALSLAAVLLIATIIWLRLLNRRYPTAESRRRLRRAEVDPRAVLTGAGLIFTVLLLAIAASVGDVVTYAKNVRQVQQAAASLGGRVGSPQAQVLLGNDHHYLFKPIIADEAGKIGSIRVSQRQLKLVQLNDGRYALLTDSEGER